MEIRYPYNLPFKKVLCHTSKFSKAQICLLKSLLPFWWSFTSRSIYSWSKKEECEERKNDNNVMTEGLSLTNESCTGWCKKDKQKLISKESSNIGG